MRPTLVHQQDETDCGAACIATICKYYGKRISITKIRNLAGTDTKGTSGKGIVKAANELGFSCKGLISKEKKIQKDYPYPLIAHIKRDGLEHYVVVYKIKNDKILIADPAIGLHWEKLKIFYDWWTEIFFFISPNEDFEKTNETKDFFHRFLYLLIENKSLAISTFMASLILTIIGILSAFYFRFLIDDVIYSSLPQSLISISLIYLLAIIFQAILGFCRSHLIMFFSNKLEAKLSLEYYRHILHLPLDFFSKRKTGEILSRLNDISTIKNALSNIAISVILDCVMLIFGGIVLFTFSSRLVIIAALPVLISALIILLFSSPFKKLIYRHSVIEADKYSHYVESINGISTIKALSTENDSYEKTELKTLESINTGFKLGNLGNLQGTIQNFLNQAGNLAIYWYGSYLIMQGQLSLGELISFVTLLGYFLGPLSRFATMQPQLQEISNAGRRLGEILDLQTEQSLNTGKIKVKNSLGKIKIENLSFSYGTRGNTLENINLEIEPGEKVAFVGPSGSGKTTLVKLILKFYQREKGEIFLDNQNIKDIETTSYRKQFGYVPQEILLFSGTIEENIAWGNYDVSAKDIFDAAKETEALDFISKLPDRFATKVGERGASLSGGERQRIALARILLRKPKIIVLDEATSALDSISEAAIMKTIKKISEKTTILIVAHRLSTIKNCDKIFVLQNGHLMESGKHRELLSKNGIYAQMWKSQNQDIEE